jgi:hypothetical protein
VKTSIARFDSWEAFLAAACVVSYQGDDGGHTEGREKFYGTPSFEAALKVAREGWPEGVEKVQQIRATIGSAVQSLASSRAESIGYDVFGEYVDVGRFLCGEPECFGVRVSDDSNSKRVVRINVNLGVSGSVSHEAIFARGAVVIAAIDVIESAGVRVEVYGVHGSLKCDKKKLHETHVLLKTASQPLDIDRLVFALCHPSSVRRLSFSVFEKYGLRAGYSYPHEVRVEEGITTRPARRGLDFTKQELLDEIKWICEQAGIDIPQEEVDALAAL